MFLFAHIKITMYICIVFKTNNKNNMEKEQEILILRQKLTEYKLIEKMQRWTFQNSKDLTNRKVDAILDEHGRTIRAIEAIEARLKELEN